MEDAVFYKSAERNPDNEIKLSAKEKPCSQDRCFHCMVGLGDMEQSMILIEETLSLPPTDTVALSERSTDAHKRLYLADDSFTELQYSIEDLELLASWPRPVCKMSRLILFVPSKLHFVWVSVPAIDRLAMINVLTMMKKLKEFNDMVRAQRLLLLLSEPLPLSALEDKAACPVCSDELDEGEENCQHPVRLCCDESISSDWNISKTGTRTVGIPTGHLVVPTVGK
jgi:hypothetical protein